jgi:hypothetical protein
MATTKITSPDLFDLGSLSSALRLPSGTTAQRPTSPSTGEWRYNTTTNYVEFYDGAEWRDLQSEEIPPVPSENFNTVVYTGNGSTQSITGVGFKPDFVWIKPTNFSDNHVVSNSTRGVNKSLAPNTTATEQSLGVTSFDADGFSLPNWGNVNSNGDTFVAWCWKANAGTTSSNTDGDITSTVQVNNKAGFSIVQYDGNGTNGQSVGHGLGTTPALIINKATTWQNAWGVWHQSIPGNATMYLQDNSTPGAAQLGTPNSTTFQTTHVGTYTVGTYINYCFKEVPGFSKFSSYTGNGNATGPVVNTGFEPAFIIIRDITASDNWGIVDNKRAPLNPRQTWLRANLANAEFTNTVDSVNFFSNGFQVAGTSVSNFLNESGHTFIYIAFAADASAAPTLADSFATALYDGNGGTQSITGLGFSPSLAWIKRRSDNEDHAWFDTQRGVQRQISSNLSSAGYTTTNAISSFDADGWTTGNNGATNASGEKYVAWNWKAASVPTINTDGTDTSIVSANLAAGFSIAVLPNKAGTQNLGHGLDGVPDLIIMKQYEGGTGNWSTYNSPIGVRNFMNLNTNDSNTVASPGYEYDAVTATTITNLISGSTYSYIYYCFKSVAGFSKIGSYTGNGGAKSVTGLGFQPNFIMIKLTNGGGGWMMYDSARTVSVGDNPGTANARPYLMANTNGKENGATSYNVDLDSDGFSMDTSAGDLNANGDNYIYMAFKENPTPYPVAGNMSFLVVAGGGGGSSSAAGNIGGPGGGAGGLRTSYGLTSGGGSSGESDITLAAGTYTITVGAGGSGASTNADGSDGSDSSIAATGLTTITSIGGGGGAKYLNPGRSGGSGGGVYAGSSIGSGTANQGFDGGTTTSGSSGGAGGGAGAVGVTGSQSSSIKPDGGAGLINKITGASVTYAGGGGGGQYITETGGPGAGGSGVGGAGSGSSGAPGGNGVVNTGSGGGGGFTNSSSTTNGGDGSSGVVVLRLLTSEYSGTTTGSPAITTDGDYSVLTYTSSGTYVHS